VNRLSRIWKLVITALTVAGLTVILSLGSWEPGHWLDPAPALSQRAIRPQDIWQQVYQRLPDLPQENQYVSRETGKVAADNTLVSRLIRYHLYVKGRPPQYRLDWKLTLADYLGVNNLMEDSLYPGYDTLKSNPLEGDRVAISRLNRAQRDALIQALVDQFNGNSPTQPAASGTPSRSPAQSGSSGNTRPRSSSPVLRSPQPGDAQLLLP